MLTLLASRMLRMKPIRFRILNLCMNTARPYKLCSIDHKNLLTFHHQLQSLRSLILSFAVTMMNATKLIFATSLHVSVQNKRYKNNTNNNWALLLIEWIIWEFKTRFYKVLFMCTRSLQMFIKVVYKYSDPKAPFKREITDLLCP